MNAAILLVFAVLVFVPLRYVYPSRTQTLSGVTNMLGSVWAVLTMWMVWQLPSTDSRVVGLSLVFPLYYMLLSFYLDRRSRRSA